MHRLLKAIPILADRFLLPGQSAAPYAARNKGKNVIKSKLFLAAALVVATSLSATAEQPSPAENYGQCQGQNRHALSTYQDWLGHAFAAQFAQMAPEDVGPALGDLLPEVRPNARADINVLFTNPDGVLTDENGNPLGCYGIKPGE